MEAITIEIEQESFELAKNKLIELSMIVENTAIRLENAFKMASKTGVICEWYLDDDSVWHTACNSEFVFTDGDPHDNEFDFCPYCGRALVVGDNVND